MGPEVTNATSSATRIAFCITELEPGGAERCLVELATRLDRRQFEPVVYCLAGRPSGNPSLADRLERAGVAVHCFDAKSRLAFPLVLRKLRRRIERDAPRLVQTFLFHANVLAAWAARHAGVEHVVTGIRVAERHAGWHLGLARWADRWVERHVCVGQSVRDFSLRQGRLPAEKLVVIPNGVDVDRFAAAVPCPLTELGITPPRRAITFVGRLSPQKGLEYLLPHCRAIFDALREHDLLVVGDGPRRGHLEGAVNRLGLAQRVHFVGYRHNVPEIMAASDLVVVPSLWEGMSNVVLEAMASGKPLVATAVEGMAEELGPAAKAQIVHGNFEQGPVAPIFEDVAARVIAILGNPPLSRSLGEENQRRAREFFGFPAMVEAYQGLYRELLSGRA